MKPADAAMFAAADQRLIDVSQWVRESPRFLLDLMRGVEWPPLQEGEALCVFPVEPVEALFMRGRV